MGVFYAKNGLTFERVDGQIVVKVLDAKTLTGDFEAALSESEFASVVAFASRRGEDGDTYREALDFLEKE